jgi:peptide/nickel transport system substrate-binding protein
MCSRGIDRCDARVDRRRTEGGTALNLCHSGGRRIGLGQAVAALVGLTLCLIACALAPIASTPVGGGGAPQPAQQKTMTIALQGEPATVHPIMGGEIGGSPAGHVNGAIHQRLTTYDNRGNPIAQVAAEVPSFAAGSWVLNQDGSMRTTYRLRANVLWHDGRPLTAPDVVFAWRVARDPELPIASRDVAGLISSIDTPDDRTVVLNWSKPYPQANVLGEFEMSPLPRHLLEETYNADKEAFQRLPYWTTEFVGLGPYRLDRWELGSRWILKAFDQFYGEQPKIGTVILTFIADESATTANMMAGAIDGEIRGIDFSKVMLVKEEWEKAGHKPLVTVESVGTRVVETQYRDPKPAAITDARIRRGLLHAIDRQSMAETIYGGYTATADSVIVPDDPRFGWVKDAATKYAYDQRRAQEVLAEAGWHRGTDGNMLAATGERVQLSLWSTAGGQWEASQAINGDSWRTIGIAVDEYVIPSARARDREVTASYPNFYGAFYNLAYLTPVRVVLTSECPTPENRYVGINRGCYQNPELDGIASALVTAATPTDQQRLWAELVRLQSQELPIMPMTHVVQANSFREGVRGPVGESWRAGSSYLWNLADWDIQ